MSPFGDYNGSLGARVKRWNADARAEMEARSDAGGVSADYARELTDRGAKAQARREENTARAAAEAGASYGEEGRAAARARTEQVLRDAGYEGDQ